MNWEEYQKNTYGDEPNHLTIYAVSNLKFENAIDLCCGSGNDTIYMLQNDKNVLAIDGILNEDYILSRLTENQKKMINFNQSFLEDVNLPKTELILSIFALPFCKPNKFLDLWKNIKQALEPNGIIVANLFGKGNYYKDNPNVNSFTKEEVLELLKDFDILKWEEQDFDRKSDNTHWHFYDFVAKRKS